MDLTIVLDGSTVPPGEDVGNKARSLAAMCALDLPVPAAFVLPTSVGRSFARPMSGPAPTDGPWESLDLWRTWMPHSELRSPVCRDRIGTFGMTPDALMDLWVQTRARAAVEDRRDQRPRPLRQRAVAAVSDEELLLRYWCRPRSRRHPRRGARRPGLRLPRRDDQARSRAAPDGHPPPAARVLPPRRHRAEAPEGMTVFETLRYDADGPIATITLNRPDELNTIVPPMTDELEAAVNRAVLDQGVKVIVLRGAGRSFCAGFDFGEGFHYWDDKLATDAAGTRARSSSSRRHPPRGGCRSS